MSSTSDSDEDINFINELRAPAPRTFKERQNYAETLDDVNFLRRFRLSKESFLLLLDKIRDKISPTTSR